ncbi:MAG TPA: hypothetical protein VGP80_14915, partial [Gemmatimonadales bacterium]|nr:hypothetical protein [Gemmatimonadales bacterium]
GIVVVSVAINWSLAMVRSQGTVFENVKHVVLEGLQLPWLTVIGKTAKQYAPWLGSVSPSFIFLLLAVMIVLIWRVQNPWKRFELSGGG